MSIDTLIDSLPGDAKDLASNYAALVRGNTRLTPQQLWGAVAASALAAGNSILAEAALDEAARQLGKKALEAARSAADAMSASVTLRRGVDVVDQELWLTAVSVVHGCSKCITAHQQALRDKGISEDTILNVVRIASVLRAISGVLAAERVTAVA